jgi:hypothetical protein
VTWSASSASAAAAAAAAIGLEWSSNCGKGVRTDATSGAGVRVASTSSGGGVRVTGNVGRQPRGNHRIRRRRAYRGGLGRRGSGLVRPSPLRGPPSLRAEGVRGAASSGAGVGAAAPWTSGGGVGVSSAASACAAASGGGAEMSSGGGVSGPESSARTAGGFRGQRGGFGVHVQSARGRLRRTDFHRPLVAAGAGSALRRAPRPGHRPAPASRRRSSPWPQPQVRERASWDLRPESRAGSRPQVQAREGWPRRRLSRAHPARGLAAWRRGRELHVAASSSACATVGVAKSPE